MTTANNKKIEMHMKLDCLSLMQAVEEFEKEYIHRFPA